MGTERSSQSPKTGKVAEMEAPFWCKPCKWLFRSDRAAGLGWNDEGKPYCEKCKTVVTVWGTNASHAFHLREGEKERRAAGKKGECLRPLGQQAPRPKSMPKSLERMTVLFPDLAEMEPPRWYNDLWWAICRRGTAIEDLDVGKVVTELSDNDRMKYQTSFENLVMPMQEIGEVNPKPSKLLGILDLRGQVGGKAILWESAVTEGVLYLEVPVPASTCALATISFVRYLKGKGITPVLLLGERQDLEFLRMVDMLCMLPILGAERCVKDEMESSAHPPWINRWKNHTRAGFLVFKTMLERVKMIAMMTCATMRIHDPTLASQNRPVPRWAFYAYGNYKIVLETVAGFTDEEEKDKATGWRKVVDHETRRLIKWECDCKWHLPSEYAGRFNLAMPSDMWQQVWQMLSEGIADLEAEEQALKKLVKDAVVQQDREFDEAEKKRKRIAELAAAEAEASKRARVEREDSVHSPTSVASPVLDAATISQIAEHVRASC